MMAALGTTWGWLLIGCTVGYALWVVVYFYVADRKTKGGRSTNREAHTSLKARRKTDIVGKSRFVLPPRRQPQPQTAVDFENEKPNENTDIFAPASVPEHPRQIAPEELDEVFGDVPDGEANEPLNIDFPLYENVKSFPDEQAEGPDIDAEDDTEDLPLLGRTLAQGVSFEQLGEAYRLMVQDPPITNEQREETGRILLGLKGTDMFEAIVSGRPDGNDKVKNLIDTYLTAFNRQMSQRSGESPSLQGEVPAGFNVRSYE